MAEHPEICLMNSQKFIREILKRIIVSARPESNGFDAIGQNNGSNTASQPKSMLRKVPSKDRGETSYTRTLYPGPEMKLLPKASIHAWFVGHSLMMHIRRHYSGVVTTICSSATSSLPKTQRSRTRKIWVRLQPWSLSTKGRWHTRSRTQCHRSLCQP